MYENCCVFIDTHSIFMMEILRWICQNFQKEMAIHFDNAGKEVSLFALSTVPPSCHLVGPLAYENRPCCAYCLVLYQGRIHSTLASLQVVQALVDRKVICQVYTDGPTDRRIDGPMYRRTDGPMDRSTDGPTNRFTDGPTDRVASSWLKTYSKQHISTANLYSLYKHIFLWPANYSF